MLHTFDLFTDLFIAIPLSSILSSCRVPVPLLQSGCLYNGSHELIFPFVWRCFKTAWSSLHLSVPINVLYPFFWCGFWFVPQILLINFLSKYFVLSPVSWSDVSHFIFPRSDAIYFVLDSLKMSLYLLWLNCSYFEGFLKIFHLLFWCWTFLHVFLQCPFFHCCTLGWISQIFCRFPFQRRFFINDLFNCAVRNRY